MSDADRVRAFLEGWDAALRCNAETMSWVPPEHLEYVVRENERRHGIPPGACRRTCDTGPHAQRRTSRTHQLRQASTRREPARPEHSRRNRGAIVSECPVCQGDKTLRSWDFVSAKWASGPCLSCDGAGEVDVMAMPVDGNGNRLPRCSQCGDADTGWVEQEIIECAACGETTLVELGFDEEPS